MINKIGEGRKGRRIRETEEKLGKKYERPWRSKDELRRMLDITDVA